MTFTDGHLRSLTAVLSQNKVIENINLVGNTKLARDEEIISEFILLVGRRLKVREGNLNANERLAHMGVYMPEIEPVWTDISSVVRPATSRPG
jgi:hypothetical protein